MGQVLYSATPIETVLNTAQTEISGAIVAALPAAGIIFASIAGIMIGFKIFKRVTGARS